MGVEPFLLASALNVAVGQLVVRKICQYCKVEYQPAPEVVENIKVTLGKMLPPNASCKLFKGQGCPKCNNTGYFGRVGIYEVLVITEKIIKLILERASIQDIESAGVQNGMITMKQDGYQKVLEGITTMEEVLRVAQD